MGKYDDIPERNMLLLLKRTVRIDGKRFLRLVCLDIEQGSIALLADHNGRPEEGLHSWNSDIANIKEMQVIRAKYKDFKVKKSNINDIVLLVSQFEIVARDADFAKYQEKLAYLEMRAMIKEKTAELQGSYLETLIPVIKEPVYVNFFDLKTHFYQDDFKLMKYALISLETLEITGREISFGNSVINISDERLATSSIDGKYFTGLALFYINGDNNDHRINFRIERLFGDFDEDPTEPISCAFMVNDLYDELDMIPIPKLSDYEEGGTLSEGPDFDEWVSGTKTAYPYDDVDDDLANENDSNWGLVDDIESLIEWDERYQELDEGEDEAIPPEQLMQMDIDELIVELRTRIDAIPDYTVNNPKANDFATNYDVVKTPSKNHDR